MRKYLSCILTVLILLQAVVFPINASSFMSVTLSNASGKAGEYVELDLNIDSTIPAKVVIISFSSELIDSYDSDKLELVAFTDAGELVDKTMLIQMGATLDAVLSVEMETISLIYTAIPDPFEGKICKVKFLIKEGVPAGEIPVKISVIAHYNDEEEVAEELINITNAVITVTEEPTTVPVNSVSLNKSTLTLTEGDTANLTETVSPTTATNKAVTWSSNKPSVATVDANGKVTAVKAGTATITVTTEDGGKTDTCRVTVNCAHSSKTSVSAQASTCSEKGWDAYKECDCGQLFDVNGNEIDEIPYRAIADHTYSEDWSKDATNHWHAATCEHTDEVSDKAAHVYDDASDIDCNTCGCEREIAHEHTYSEDWSKDATNHWHECTGEDCDELLDKATHVDKDSNGECDSCQYIINEKEQILYGDVDGDGSVNSADSTRLNQYFAGYSVEINPTNADVNGDSSVTRADAMILARHLAAWSGYETLPVVGTVVSVIASGNCNETITWSLDSHGTLTIAGQGNMPDYGREVLHNDNTQPWNEYRNNILKIVISEGIKELGWYNFPQCENLKKIEIADSVTNLGRGTFVGCSSLEKVVLPDSITFMGWDVFYGCENLSEVKLSENLNHIGWHAFFGCTSLETITIPASIGDIGKNCFKGCTNLKEVYFYGSVPAFESGEFHETHPDLMLYYINGKAGWTPSTWEAPDGTVYNTATWIPENAG